VGAPGSESNQKFGNFNSANSRCCIIASPQLKGVGGVGGVGFKPLQHHRWSMVDGTFELKTWTTTHPHRHRRRRRGGILGPRCLRRRCRLLCRTASAATRKGQKPWTLLFISCCNLLSENKRGSRFWHHSSCRNYSTTVRSRSIFGITTTNWTQTAYCGQRRSEAIHTT